jgi:hypothetical protein
MGRYNYTNALGTLKGWAIKEGYKDIFLDYHDTSQIFWQDDTYNIPKEIRIEGKWPIETKVYIFLHELGHHQLRKDWTKFKKTLPALAHAEHLHFARNDGKYKRRVVYTVSCMEEEFKAWDEGLKLAEKLGIRVNVEKWTALKAKCLISYMRYYSGKK